MAVRLIADSGSTKTDWRLIDPQGNIHQVRTHGLNPYFTSDEEFITALNEGPASVFAAEAVEQIHFYGSGVSNPEQQSRVQKLMKELFPNADLFIEHDLLAAARASCGRQAGITMILGTGANSCEYDGDEIVANVPSLGYILGDEGSGADLGKRWMSAHLNERAPQALSDSFQKSYQLEHQEVINRVYKGKQPNRYLASFAPFLSKNVRDPYINQLVAQAFKEFFERYITHYPHHKEWPVHACGSVAYYFAPLLRSIAETYEVHMGTILKDPIAALTLYHLEES